MGAIVAIGGGSIRRMETEPIDREIIRLTGMTRPHALFIPTASSDSDVYCRHFERAYRVIATKERASAYAVSVSRGRVLERRLPKTTEYLPVETLRGTAGPA